MLFIEIIAVYSENKKNLQIQNTALNSKICGTYNYH
jgi:hypothetical protein